MRGLRYWLMAFSMAMPLAAPAQQTGGYEVHVPAQPGEDQTALLGKALDTLILQHGGTQASLDTPAIKALRRNPEKLARQYGFDAQGFVVQFEPRPTDNALRAAGIGAPAQDTADVQPAVVVGPREALLWWIEENAEGTALLSATQEMAQALVQRAQAQGLKLQFPLADLSEQLAVTPAVLDSPDATGLRSLSQRYGASNVLVLMTRQQDTQWQARWRLLTTGADQRGDLSAPDEGGLDDGLLRAWLPVLPAASAPNPVAAHVRSLHLEVEGVNFAHYAELQRLLQPFDAQLQEAGPNRAVYVVQADEGQLRQLLQSRGLKESVQSSPADSGVTASGGTLRFSW